MWPACEADTDRDAGSTVAKAVVERPAAPERPAWGRAPGVGSTDWSPSLLTAAVHRNPNDPALAEALASSDGRLYAQGAWTLARTWGPGSAARLSAVLGPDVPADADRSQLFAALALLDPPVKRRGEPARPDGALLALEHAIWSRYAVTEDAEEVGGLLLAAARIGGPRSVDRFAVDLARPPAAADEARYLDAAVALGMLCSRGHALTKPALEALAEGVRATGRSARKGAAYALGRCAGPSAELLAGEQRKVLVQRLAPMLTAKGDPEEARLAWRALGGLGEAPDPVPDDVLIDPELPWQVTVQAVRALTGTAAGRSLVAKRLADLDLARFAGPNMHAVIAALQGLRPAVDGTPELLDALASLGSKMSSAIADASPSALRPLVLVRCELAVLRAIRSGADDELAACVHPDVSLPDGFADTLLVEALLHRGTDGGSGADRVAALLARAEDPRPLVATRAISALAEIDDARVNGTLRAALERRDVGVIAAAAGAIAARSVDSGKRDPEAVEPLRIVVRELSNADAVEARIMAIEALGSLARRSGKESPKPGSDPPPDWLGPTMLELARDPNVAVRRAAAQAAHGHADLLAKLEAAAPVGFADAVPPAVREALTPPSAGEPVALRVHTGIGVIEIDLRGSPAPIAHRTLAALAEREYFNGLRFHRVVPDFVIQGGDPRGDGYGGPGYLIPCEWSNLRYERGTVGIALAGKDTGGSQLFITHSPQPHLDGRYTVVGHVVDGMDVVDGIFAHEVIDRIEVVRAAP